VQGTAGAVGRALLQAWSCAVLVAALAMATAAAQQGSSAAIREALRAGCGSIWKLLHIRQCCLWELGVLACVC